MIAIGYAFESSQDELEKIFHRINSIGRIIGLKAKYGRRMQIVSKPNSSRSLSNSIQVTSVPMPTSSSKQWRTTEQVFRMNMQIQHQRELEKKNLNLKSRCRPTPWYSGGNWISILLRRGITNYHPVSLVIYQQRPKINKWWRQTIFIGNLDAKQDGFLTGRHIGWSSNEKNYTRQQPFLPNININYN